MRTLATITRIADRAPAGALADALGLAALCLLIVTGFAASAFV